MTLKLLTTTLHLFWCHQFNAHDGQIITKQRVKPNIGTKSLTAFLVTAGFKDVS